MPGVPYDRPLQQDFLHELCHNVVAAVSLGIGRVLDLS
jgi:hypothetical protein